MKRLVCLMVLLLSTALACGGGGNSNISVGGGNNGDENNENSDDMPDGGGGENSNNIAPGDMGNGVNSGVEDMSTPDAGDPDDMATPDDMANPADMTTPEDMGSDTGIDMSTANCPPENLGYGQSCDCDQACLSGLCLGDTADTPGTCSRTCMSRQDCPVGDNACVMDQDLMKRVCKPDETGDSCDNNGDAAPSMCDLGICIEGGSSYQPPHFCTIRCMSASDCKMGHACSPARCKMGSTGEFSCIPTLVAHRAGASKPTILAAFPLDTNLCMPVGQDLGQDGWCTAAPSNQFACASGICDDDADRCTGQCTDTADCPAGGCVDLDVSDPTLPIRICDFPAP